MGGIREQRDNSNDSKEVIDGRRISIKLWNVEYFFRIIDEELQDFLKYDRCYKLADKYLIAMVFMYFLRASFQREEYTRFNFFVALFLAHDMEEDDYDNRNGLLEAPGYRWSCSALLARREEIFKRMDYRAVVSRACCETVMNVMKPKHPVWRRGRDPVHAGATPKFHKVRSVCPNCIDLVSPRSE